MPQPTFLRRILLFQSSFPISNLRILRSHSSTAAAAQTQYLQNEKPNESKLKNRGKFLTLPPYSSTISSSALGKALSSASKTVAASETTALKWVLNCCPELPRNLVQKLFRLRQVKKELIIGGDQDEMEHKQKRVAAKDLMNIGDRLLLPLSVQAVASEKQQCHYDYSEQDVNFIRSLELYKDEAVIVVNKPPGLPVQGGIGIKTSFDELAASCLRYDYSEPPRLVHRLDRDSSGILVMGRTQRSATVLHSVFREKTFAASSDDIGEKRRVLQRRYWALVIGTPRHQNGLISAPLGKVIVDNGKSDRITVIENTENASFQHAVTHYRVLESSHGYTWLELSPSTGRKHQLRVHCAEVLGTPIVGDYKYGWQVHRKWKQFPLTNLEKTFKDEVPCEKALPFGIDLESGSICEKHPRLHLHCKKMILPDVSQALKDMKLSAEYDFSDLKSIELDAPLPSYMKRSWNILNS
ncbi:RNA pseudouridine synthase 4, mitochondrial [Mercurialis annua]|uniref:RNA pseudouridine synthase 4, mitochondrial n=1 Tax=Mercurialis annua TaxID=3986 RepID=UPI00215E2E59|nr:RNA pseudouridine synthase 4, mitochondrial [Mercurialis annua]